MYKVAQGIVVPTSIANFHRYIDVHLRQGGVYFIEDDNKNWMIISDKFINSSLLKTKSGNDKVSYHRMDIAITDQTSITLIFEGVNYFVSEPVFVYLPTKEEEALFKTIQA